MLCFGCRAFTAYVRLRTLQLNLASIPANEAAAGCEHLLQQVKNGVELPKPMTSAEQLVMNAQEMM